MNRELRSEETHVRWNLDQGCVYCGLTGRDVGEHVRPRVWPGPATEILPSCHRCNVDKHSNDPVTWYFILVRRHGAVVGREETLSDRRATMIAERWGEEIRASALDALAMLDANPSDEAAHYLSLDYVSDIAGPAVWGGHCSCGWETSESREPTLGQQVWKDHYTSVLLSIAGES